MNRIQTKYGEVIVPASSAPIVLSLTAYGQWRDHELQLLQRFVEPEMKVLNIGANIGSQILALSHMVGDDGEVIAFERNPSAFRHLAANIAHNDIRNAVIENMSVGDAPGWLDLSAVIDPCSGDVTAAATPMQFDGSSFRPGTGRAVPVVALDDLIRAEGADVIWIDVDSAIPAILWGARAMLVHHRPVLYIKNDRPGRQSEEMIDRLKSLGYANFWHASPLFAPDNFRGNDNNLFGNRVVINMLCFPGERQPENVGLRKVAGSKGHPRKVSLAHSGSAPQRQPSDSYGVTTPVTAPVLRPGL